MPRDGDDLLAEMRKVREAFDKHYSALRVDTLEEGLNDLYKRMNRPGGFEGGYGSDALECKDALQMCLDRHSWERQKTEGREVDYTPSSDESESAVIAQKAWRKIIRHGRFERLDHDEQKSLSAFSFGGSAVRNRFGLDCWLRR